MKMATQTDFRSDAEIMEANRQMMVQMGWNDDLTKYKGFTEQELHEAFDAAINSPDTTFPIKYDHAPWKSPFRTVLTKMADEAYHAFTRRVRCLYTAIEYIDADLANVMFFDNSAEIITRGYQAW